MALACTLPHALLRPEAMSSSMAGVTSLSHTKSTHDVQLAASQQSAVQQVICLAIAGGSACVLGCLRFQPKLPAIVHIKAASNLPAETDAWWQCCRNSQRVEKAKQQVQEAGRSGEVSSYIADLGDMQQIQAFAQQVQKDHPDIHVLINNAGESLHLLHVQLGLPR